MKKILLVSSLLFLSITAIAESNLRCEFHKSSVELKGIQQRDISYYKKIVESTKSEKIIHISYQDSFFSNKLKSDSFEVDRDISSGNTKITFTEKSPPFSTKIEHEIHKQFLTYTKKVFRRYGTGVRLSGEDEPEIPLIAKHEYLCTKLN